MFAKGTIVYLLQDILSCDESLEETTIVTLPMGMTGIVEKGLQWISFQVHETYYVHFGGSLRLVDGVYLTLDLLDIARIALVA